MFLEGIGDQIENVETKIDTLKAKNDPRNIRQLDILKDKLSKLKEKKSKETKNFLKTTGNAVGANVKVEKGSDAAVYKLKARKYDDQIRDLRMDLRVKESPEERKNIIDRIKTIEDRKRSVLQKGAKAMQKRRVGA